MDAVEYVVESGVLTQTKLEMLASINEDVFGFGERPQDLASFLSERERVLLCMALQDGVPVGFKLGFQQAPDVFESWRGGVVCSVRRKGIATHLLHLQHEWCVRRGFRTITTTTNSDNSPMLILNLRGGFHIVGTFSNQSQHLKIVLEKPLS